MSDAVHTFDNGLRVYARHLIPVQVERYAAGVNLHEPEEEAWITKLAKGLPPGRAVFVDIGAAIGYYCFLVAKARPDAELHAYEPDTDNHARLRENAALNGGVNVTIHSEGVGPFAGQAVLVGSGFTGFLAPPNAAPGRAVPMTTIDAIARALGGIGLLKMDIQGGEAAALAGAGEALKARTIANLVVGTHSPQLHAECLAVFQRAAYRILFESMRVQHQPDGMIVAATGKR